MGTFVLLQRFNHLLLISGRRIGFSRFVDGRKEDRGGLYYLFTSVA